MIATILGLNRSLHLICRLNKHYSDSDSELDGWSCRQLLMHVRSRKCSRSRLYQFVLDYNLCGAIM